MNRDTPVKQMTDLQLDWEFRDVKKKDTPANKHHAYFQKHKTEVFKEIERRLSDAKVQS